MIFPFAYFIRSFLKFCEEKKYNNQNDTIQKE